MRDLAAGCLAARMEGEGVLDLNHMEEAVGSTCQLFMAVHCNLELARPAPPAECRLRGAKAEPPVPQVVVLQSEGRMQPDELEALADLAASGCKAAGELMRGALLGNTKRLALARGPVAF